MGDLRVVRAGAGSGKTHDLCEHIAGCVAAGLDPAKILATTFTRKAAAELKGRIQARLLAHRDDRADRLVAGDEGEGEAGHQPLVLLVVGAANPARVDAQQRLFRPGPLRQRQLPQLQAARLRLDDAARLGGEAGHGAAIIPPRVS